MTDASGSQTLPRSYDIYSSGFHSPAEKPQRVRDVFKICQAFGLHLRDSLKHPRARNVNDIDVAPFRTPHRDRYCQNTDAGVIYAAAAPSFRTNLVANLFSEAPARVKDNSRTPT